MADLDRTHFLLIPKPRLRLEVSVGRPGCQGGVGQQGKATGAQWTVQTVDLLGLTGLRAEDRVWVDLIIAIAQEQNVDE